MKLKGIIAVLFLTAASVQTAWAQEGMLVWRNGKFVSFHIDEVDSIQFVNSFHDVKREYVDLGLPSGTLWATCNIGADSPEGYGDYFAWGETSTKADYSWGTYKYCNGTNTTITKYCTNSSYGYVDNKKELEAMDDAATANWGEDWQMPSYEQMLELIDDSYTRTVFKEQHGIFGRQIISKSNGNSIFLPGGGYYYGTSLHSVDSIGYYWTRTITISSEIKSGGLDARAMYFTSGKIGEGPGWTDGNRPHGRSVRAVRKED